MFVCDAVTTPRLFGGDAGALQFGAELSSPAVPYLLIERMATSGPDADTDHANYVELGDQSVASFDGIERLELSLDRKFLTLWLRFDISGVGSVVQIRSASPVDDASVEWLTALQAELV